MADEDVIDDSVSAGDFSSWLSGVLNVITGDGESDVPCNGCTACCRSSQFVHVSPQEADALAHIPRALLFPAPGMPSGHLLLGYDEQGACPMLIDNRCSIYEHRPTACRMYDCRVIPAAGVDVSEDQPLVAERTARWRFDYRREADRVRHAAVRTAASFLRSHADDLPGGAVPTNPTQLAVLAVEVHEVFIDEGDNASAAAVVDPRPADVEVAVRRRRNDRRRR